MATHLYCGQPGAGKTTSAMQRSVVSWVRSGGIIVTNVPLRREAWDTIVDTWRVEDAEKGKDPVPYALDLQLVQVPKWILEDGTAAKEGDPAAHRYFSMRHDYEQHLPTRDHKGRGVMFVIDEAHEVLPSGMRFDVHRTGPRNGQLLETFPNFIHLLFTMQRHHLINFTLITQEPLSISGKMLKQVHSSFYIQNAAMKGSDRRWTAKIWNRRPPNNFETALMKDCDDAIASPQPYDRKVQALFISNTQVKDDATVDRSLEGTYHLSQSIWRRPFIRYGMPAAAAAMAYLGYGLISKPESDAKALAATHTASPAKDSRVESNRPAAPAASKTKPATDTVQASAASLAIGDLESVEQSTRVADTMRTEATYYVTLFARHSTAPGRPDLDGAPSVKVSDLQGRSSVFWLADYASWWRYELQIIQCGWVLKRPDNVRYVYDPSCLTRENQNAASAPQQTPAQPSRQVVGTAAGMAIPAL